MKTLRSFGKVCLKGVEVVLGSCALTVFLIAYGIFYVFVSRIEPTPEEAGRWWNPIRL